MNSEAGTLFAENYDATLDLTAQAGDTTLEGVQGQVSVTTQAGSITVSLAGTSWAGSGMTASVQSGNISVIHPVNYQAAFTAETVNGTASIDSQSATAPPALEATVTAGSGAPIVLKTGNGNVSVRWVGSAANQVGPRQSIQAVSPSAGRGRYPDQTS